MSLLPGNSDFCDCGEEVEAGRAEMRQLFAKGCLSETNKLPTFDEFSQEQTCLKLMSEFVKDRHKQKASVVILTLSFEPEGIDERMGYLHHGGQNIMDLLDSLGSSQYSSEKQRKIYVHFINSMRK